MIVVESDMDCKMFFEHTIEDVMKWSVAESFEGGRDNCCGGGVTEMIGLEGTGLEVTEMKSLEEAEMIAVEEAQMDEAKMTVVGAEMTVVEEAEERATDFGANNCSWLQV